jgi:hypothetical protein
MTSKKYRDRYDMLKNIGMVLCTEPNFEGETKLYGLGLYKNMKLKNFSCIIMPNISVKFYHGSQCVSKVAGEYSDTASCTSVAPKYSDPGVDFQLVNDFNSKVTIDSFTVQIDDFSKLPISDLLIKNIGIIMYPTPVYTGTRKNYALDPPQMISSPRPVTSFKMNPPYPNLAKFSFILFPNTSVRFDSGADSGAIPVLDYTTDNQFLFVKDAESGKPVTNMTLEVIEPTNKQYVVEKFEPDGAQCTSLFTLRSFINIVLIIALIYVVYLIYTELKK